MTGVRGLARLWLQEAVIRALWIDGITWRLRARREFAHEEDRHGRE